MATWNWQVEFNQLADQLVPLSGQARSVQGELLRCIGKLRDEGYRNGNGNFDTGYRMMCQFLRETLSDPHVFTQEEIAQINRSIDRILIVDRPDVMGPISSYDVIAEKVVRWCLFRKAPIPHRANPALYR